MIALSGSKAALLSLGQYALSIVFVYTALRNAPHRFWGGRAGKTLIVVSTVFAVAVLALQSEGDYVAAGLALAYRVVSFGDIYIFAYPDATIESIRGSNPLIGLFGGFLSTFRLFPQEAVYPNIGYQFTGIVFPDLELIVGPNPQHAVFGYHYFGPWAFVFSFALGVFTSRVQARFYNRPHATFVSGLLAFLLYFSLVNISVDFEYALSKLASAIIGTSSCSVRSCSCCRARRSSDRCGAGARSRRPLACRRHDRRSGLESGSVRSRGLLPRSARAVHRPAHRRGRPRRPAAARGHRQQRSVAPAAVSGGGRRSDPGSNVQLDFSGYFEGFDRLLVTDPDAAAANVLFANDSLLTHHATATILRHVLQLDGLLTQLLVPAMAGKFDPYRSICLRSPWSGHPGY